MNNYMNLTNSTAASATVPMTTTLWTGNAARSAPVVRGSDDAEDRSLLAVGPSLITNSGTPTDEQFEDIRSRFGDPRANVRPDDYFVFRLIASGDGLDSYFTRQDLHTSFPNMGNDLHKGQSLLGSHLMATFSYGSSFAGEVIPAQVDRAEYEPTFYPQWDAPELRTQNWLVGDYFIGRGVTVNTQNTDHLIRSIELGNVRKTSISFMVGSYVCGIDNRDLVPTMFGPMPDEECNHFPGIAYDDNKGGKQIAWALMKNNTLVETSLVYKNASPSSMLLRKAEALASRGHLGSRDIEKLESRFAIRLPRFEATVFPVTTTASANSADVRFDAQVQEDNDMANRRRGGTDAARELVREAITAEPEPEDETTPETAVPAEADATSEAAADPEPDTTEDADASEAETEDVTADAEATDDTADEGDAAAEPDSASADAGEARHSGHKHSGKDKGGHLRKNLDAEAEADAAPVTEAAETTDEEDEAETTATSESSREEDAVSAFVAAADRLASALVRNPDAFDTGLLAVASRAEKGVDLALFDAGCDTTVGTQVYRSFEIRSKKLTDALGEPLTVEAIRSLQGKAQLGDELFRELVKDAVAARVTAQGDTFSAEKYREVLLSTRDVQYVKDEVASWKAAKKDTFSPGRSVVPRQPVDLKPTKDERKALPEAPAAFAARPRGDASTSMSLIQPRKK